MDALLHHLRQVTNRLSVVHHSREKPFTAADQRLVLLGFFVVVRMHVHPHVPLASHAVTPNGNGVRQFLVLHDDGIISLLTDSGDRASVHHLVVHIHLVTRGITDLAMRLCLLCKFGDAEHHLVIVRDSKCLHNALLHLLLASLVKAIEPIDLIEEDDCEGCNYKDGDSLER